MLLHPHQPKPFSPCYNGKNLTKKTSKAMENNICIYEGKTEEMETRKIGIHHTNKLITKLNGSRQENRELFSLVTSSKKYCTIQE